MTYLQAAVGPGCMILMLFAAGCSGSSDEDADAGAAAPDGGADQEAGPPDPFTGTMKCGGVPVANPTCATCADERCCDQGEACAAEPDCLALRECRRGCAPEDRPCQEGCEAIHPQGASLDAPLTACRMHECADDCFDGADVGCGFVVSPEACQDCATSACCQIGYDARLDPAFWDYSSCIVACSDAACFQQCADDHAAGATAYGAWIECLGTNCSTACGVPPP